MTGGLKETIRSRFGRTRPPSPPSDPPDQTPAPLPRSAGSEARVTALQQALGIQFHNPELLREALTHRSYLNEIDQAWPSNERLEFLGDAVLGMISGNYLFHRMPGGDEGDLTNLRSALVRTETLARYAQEINLGQYLLLGRGEEMSKGRQRTGGLACAFEAVLAAIYADQGYEPAEHFALRFIEPELEHVVSTRTHRNAKSVLQELLQGSMQQTPSYHLLEESGPDHAKSFSVEVRVGDRILGRGRERSKRGAEQAAAEQALATLRQESAEGSG